jgi:bifunctional DNase/RNase
MVELIIDSIRVNVLSFQRVVILRVKDSDKYLPIWIGASEADAIALKLQDIQVARPMTHDLLRAALATVGATVNRIVVSDLNDDTYYAKIVIQHNGSTVEVDSRPSDALALALRTGAPVFVAERVIQEAGLPINSSLDIEVEQVEGGISERVLALKAELREAVAREQYEEAASLRDEIRRLEHQMR